MWICADAQADLRLRCQHMPRRRFTDSWDTIEYRFWNEARILLRGFAFVLRGGSGQDEFQDSSIWSNYRIRKDVWANSLDQDQTPQIAASDQGQHCLPLIQQFYTHS